MSAIFGLINFDGEPVPPERVQAMRDTMAAWGPDGGGVWLEGGAALGQLVRQGTPESVHESMPLTGADGRSVVVAAARLDNRVELCDVLEIPYPARSATSDGALILLAHERWGDDTPRHLLGDWAFAAWDRRRRHLLLARDHCGNTALYYHHAARFFAFASRLGGVLALPQVAGRLCETCLAQSLAGGAAGCTSTLREDVVRLQPGHCVILNGSKIVPLRYWQLADAPDVRLPTDAEYVERFLELYQEAVRCRLRSRRPVGATLSAGLDSSSVAALAARELAARGESLVAFTAVPLHPEVRLVFEGRMVDEWPLAHATATRLGNVDHVAVRAETLTPLGALERSLQIHDEPEYGAGNLHWIYSLLDEARRRGLGTLLTGRLGNFGVSWGGDPDRTFRLVKQGDWRGGWQALSAWKAGHRRSWPAAMKSQLAGPLKHWLKAAVVRRRVPSRAWGDGQSPIHPAFARAADLGRHQRAGLAFRALGRFTDPRWLRLAAFTPAAMWTGTFWQEAGAAHGIEVRDPTADVRVLEFCVGIPDDQYTRGRHDRWLMRRAMEGVLPPEVQWNHRRGLQAADLGHRLRSDAAALDAALARLAASPYVRSHLDLDRMERAWAALRNGVTPAAHHQGAAVLLRGVLVGRFLVDLIDVAASR